MLFAFLDLLLALAAAHVWLADDDIGSCISKETLLFVDARTEGAAAARFKKQK